MKKLLLRTSGVWATCLLICASAWSQAPCPPAEWNRSSLQALKDAKWVMESPAQREALVLALVPCLADPDPQLRDGYAFEALSAWSRKSLLSTDTQRSIFGQLMPQLEASVPDPHGFAAPFAALALAEVARGDRLAGFLSSQERNALVHAATQYVRQVKDYRGFVVGQGWRHGVAHGADLLMQLALNPAMDQAQLERLVEAALSQVVPAEGHFYVYGESERLARPVLFAARRGLMAPEWWRTALERFANPQPLATWERAFDSQSGLARLHNTKAFFLVLFANVRDSSHDGLRGALLDPVRVVLGKLP